MLTSLRITNFAIIQELHLDFVNGLVIFTGETGAGKSIILDALEAVLGGRAETNTIRTGIERAQVEAVFQLTPEIREPVHALLEAEDLLDDPDFVSLTREIRQEGRNTARINGRIVTATLQRELGAYLVDIHGQSEHLSLLRVRNHLRLLDSFAEVDLYLEPYRDLYNQLKLVRQDLDALRQSEQDAARQIDMLNYQIQEIDAARLQADEEESLKQERTRLANAESLSTYAQSALMLIETGTPEVPGISELLGSAVEALQALSRIDPTTTSIFERALAGMNSLQDLALDLQNYVETIEFNPRLLDRIEERIDLINSLKRKYGSSIEEILSFAARARDELDAITHAEERIEDLEVQEGLLLQSLTTKAQAISQERQKAAQELSRLVEVELDDLRMANARFQVSIGNRPDDNGLPLPDGSRLAFDSNGFDQVAFLIETNPGEGFKPLAKIASGGETSRLMLALKNVLVKADKVPTLVFDEIDQGIGGRVGMIVGEKLWHLSRRHQVMCVTHLPQLAAYGDLHYKVVKEMVDGRTQTEVIPLDDGNRLEELAQMLGPNSEGTRQSADEILNLVQERIRQQTV